ncbi:MAG: hypothetical protein R2697_08720 [Ilumatobacteraceae bacterium]
MASSTNRRRSIAGMLAAAVILTGCWGGGDDDATSDTTLAPGPTVTVASDDPIVTIEGQPTESGDDVELGVRLSDGTAGGDDADPSTPVAEGTALDQTQIDAIVDQLPEWSVPDTDQVDFLRPATSLEPPTIATTVDGTFPPADDGGGPTDVPDGPLEVLRYQPDGEVDIAPFVAVTFDQPMVPLGTLEQLDAADVPVTISPAVEGRWRWIGTRTLRFEVVPGVIDRLPPPPSTPSRCRPGPVRPPDRRWPRPSRGPSRRRPRRCDRWPASPTR